PSPVLLPSPRRAPGPRPGSETSRSHTCARRRCSTLLRMRHAIDALEDVADVVCRKRRVGERMQGFRVPLALQADLLNAFDQAGLYNILSVFGVTHVIPPRTLAMRLRYSFGWQAR